jgi:hypothetical protein
MLSVSSRYQAYGRHYRQSNGQAAFGSSCNTGANNSSAWVRLLPWAKIAQQQAHRQSAKYQSAKAHMKFLLPKLGLLPGGRSFLELRQQFPIGKVFPRHRESAVTMVTSSGTLFLYSAGADWQRECRVTR